MLAVPIFPVFPYGVDPCYPRELIMPANTVLPPQSPQSPVAELARTRRNDQEDFPCRP